MTTRTLDLAKQIGRVPSMTVALDAEGEKRFQGLMEDIVMVDMHQHPMVFTESMDDLLEYFRNGNYEWGYQAARHGGWAAVGTSNGFRGGIKPTHASSMDFELVLDEIGLMLADVSLHSDIAVKVSNADEILSAHGQGKIGFLPTVEHLSIGNQIHRVDVLYGMGVRLAGLTYSHKSYIGDGSYERTDSGLSDFGIAVVKRMNQLGMSIDLSPRRAPDGVGGHRALGSATPIQPQCRLHAETDQACRKGRPASGLRQEGGHCLHHVGAQLPERRSETEHQRGA